MPTIVDVPERQTAFLGNIASAFAGIAGVEAVAWCGSAALQKADFLSDYDLYVYWRTPVPLSARKKIIESRASEYQLDNNFWELEDEWIEPDGLRFNVMYRPCWEAEEEVHRRLVQHVASLGYTTASCFSLSQGDRLTDHNSWLADLQRQTQGPYPHGLLRAILRKNRPVLGGGMQSCYFQQINAALVRQDPVSLNHRVAAWLSSYFDILFAINGQFHPGEKRLLIYAEALANLPRSALLDVQQLCAFAGNGRKPNQWLSKATDAPKLFKIAALEPSSQCDGVMWSVILEAATGDNIMPGNSLHGMINTAGCWMLFRNFNWPRTEIVNKPGVLVTDELDRIYRKVHRSKHGKATVITELAKVGINVAPGSETPGYS